MRLGIDIDDTLVSTSESFDNVIKKHNINFKKKYHDEWTKEEQNFIFGNYLEEILLGAKIKEGAKKVLDYLYSQGHDLIIITARSNYHCKNIEKQTMEFIKNENLKVCDIYFHQNKKSDLAKKLKIDLMIDDSDYVYENMKKDGIKCIHFGDEIKTWDGVLEYIKENG